jgi:hypothetical protein
VRFSENARKFQSTFFGTDVKVEVFEMPVIECFTQHEDIKFEPREGKRKLRSTTVKPCEDETSEEVYSENGSDFNDKSESSDSDYKSTYKPRKQDKDNQTAKRKRYVKRSQSQKLKDNEAIKLEVSESHKNLDGTIVGYEGNRWQDITMSCTECDKVLQGPLELKIHYTQDHSPGFGGYDKYKCSFDDCEISEVVLDAFHKYINHVTELHRPSLKFCCLVCSDMFWNLDALSTHYQTCHTEHSVFNCLLCGR